MNLFLFNLHISEGLLTRNEVNRVTDMAEFNLGANGFVTHLDQ